MTSQIALQRRGWTSGYGLQQVLAAQQSTSEPPKPIPHPPTDADEVSATCDSITFASFTAEDAWELGHLLYARLLPFSAKQPVLISIALANNSQVLFQTVVGSGTVADNTNWVTRKRNTVLRWNKSSWYWNCVWKGDEDRFRKLFSMSVEQSSSYAIHGGGVPIRVAGVEGIVAVVCVSGLKQEEDHGVIMDVIRTHWQ
ncbi:hypothetical protein ACJ41O_003381 [Fusarium nematophilum]